jgi:hypothetical protein
MMLEVRGSCGIVISTMRRITRCMMMTFSLASHRLVDPTGDFGLDHAIAKMVESTDRDSFHHQACVKRAGEVLQKKPQPPLIAGAQGFDVPQEDEVGIEFNAETD